MDMAMGHKRKIRIKNIATAAMLFAVAITLSFIEGFFPTQIPGVKLGLSNIVVMFSLFFLQKRYALAIVLLKGLSTFLLKGPISGILSLSGGLFSVTVIIILIGVSKQKITYLLSSVFGALAHNIGQFFVASLILKTPLWYYLPILLFAGIGAGVATSTLLRLTLPALSKITTNRSN